MAIRKTVTCEFYGPMLAEYPGLQQSLFNRRFAMLILTAHRENADAEYDSERVIIPQKSLASCAGKVKQWMQGNFDARPYLRTFSEQVAHLEFVEADYKAGKARAIVNDVFPAKIWRLWAAELQRPWRPEGRVYWDTGLAYTRNSRAKVREEALDEAAKLLALSRIPEGRQLIEYLNALDTRLFNVVYTNKDEAFAMAHCIEDDKRQHQVLNNLNGVFDEPKPIYNPAEHSDRPYANPYSLQYVPSDIRKVLLKGKVEVDLQSVQLAVAAKDWGAMKLQAFLEQLDPADEDGIWRHLVEALGLPYERRTTKKLAKDILYPLQYGGGQATMEEKATKRIRKAQLGDLMHTHFGENAAEMVVERFLEIPIIRDLFEARQRRLEAIKQNRGAHTVWGTWVAVKRGVNPLSVLAQCGQAAEFWLMWPLAEMAMRESAFDILLWQWDGCTITFRDNREADKWLARMQEAIRLRAAEREYVTRLVKAD